MITFILAHLTLLHRSCEELVDLAAQAGYHSLTLQISPPELTRGPTHYVASGSASLKALQQRLNDTGVTVHDVGVIRLQADFDASAYEEMFETGAQLGARFVVVVCDDHDRTRVVNNLAALVALARPRGLTVALEYMVYSAVPTLEYALDLIDEVDAQAIVPLVDALHHYRSGGTAASLAQLPPERVPYIQLCDARAMERTRLDTDALRTEALTDRLLPGDGGLPLGAFLAAVPSGIPWAIEVPLKNRQAFATEHDMLVAAREKAIRLQRLESF